MTNNRDESRAEEVAIVHIIIGFLTALAGLIWAFHALHNSGVNLNSFNPFNWIRRRKWDQLYGTKPIHSLASPLEAAAVLIVGIVKQEGDISREQKKAIIQLFEDEFNLAHDKAVDAFGSSVFLVKDEINFELSVKGILAPVKSLFTTEQTSSLISLLRKVSNIEGEATEIQTRILTSVESELAQNLDSGTGTWQQS